MVILMTHSVVSRYYANVRLIMPIILVMAMLLGLLVVSIVGARVYSRRIRSHLRAVLRARGIECCANCGYRQESAAARCPECGARRSLVTGELSLMSDS